LGIHRKTGEAYPFVDPLSLRPVGLSQLDDLDYAGTFERVSAEQIADTLARLMESRERRDEQRDANKGIIARLRTRIPIRDVVAEFVQLDEKGRGHCPWHKPDRHSSFSVNDEAGYFFCFHEWKGGDVVEFLRRAKGTTTSEAVRELAQRYLTEADSGSGN
jgi:hypothetical protein